VKYFDAAIWADRVTVKRTGYSAFQLMYGVDCVFPVELEFGTRWLETLDKPITTDCLLEIRTKQLAKLESDRLEAVERMVKMRRRIKNVLMLIEKLERVLSKKKTGC
jgi:hypothetical protein